MDIPAGARVAGYVGRVGPEKNLAWLAEAAAAWCAADPKALFAIVGPSESYGPVLRSVFEKAGVSGRLLLPGSFRGPDLADAYAALDVFAFASHTDTQGIVLAEAMAAGLPIAALDAPGAREAVADGVNGRLLPHDASRGSYAAALQGLFADDMRYAAMQHASRERSRIYDRTVTARRMLGVYAALAEKSRSERRGRGPYGLMRRAAGRLCAEQKLLATKLAAASNALRGLPRD
jgi:1,2-diacylglycerol 3-alpha-glucosyltransferase